MARIGCERTAVALVASTTLAVVAAQGVAALLGAWAPDPAPIALTCTVIGLSLLSAITWSVLKTTGSVLLAAGIVSATAGAVFIWALDGPPATAVVILLIGMLQAYGGLWMGRRMPASLDGALRRRPIVAVLWGLLGLVTIFQTGRFSTFMADPSCTWGAAAPQYEAVTKHICLSAYVYAADLHRQGVENVYDEALYPYILPNPPQIPISTQVDHLQPAIEDPFQYPPPFLLLPRLALALTNDFLTIRTVWYSLQAAAFALIAVVLALWVRSRVGTVALFVFPVVWIALPTMLDFQFGQFHLFTIVLSIAAMLAFESRRQVLGGAMLAIAILAKVFPVILLIPLVIQRRWRAAGLTVAFAAVFTLLAWGVLGPKPFHAFFNYHMPRLQSGEAIAPFLEKEPSLLVWNQSPYALVMKLDRLGVPGMTEGLARVVNNWAYSAFLVGFAVLATRRMPSRARKVQVWLALLNLAALRSPAAWISYTAVGSLWLLTFLASEMPGRKRISVFLAANWLFLFLSGIAGVMVLSIAGFALMVALNVWAVSRAERPSCG